MLNGARLGKDNSLILDTTMCSSDSRPGNPRLDSKRLLRPYVRCQGKMNVVINVVSLPASSRPSTLVHRNPMCSKMPPRSLSLLLYSSAFSSTSSVSPRMLLTTLTASPSFSPICALRVSTKFAGVASSVGGAVAAAGVSLVTIDSGLGTPSIPMSSVSKTASDSSQHGPD